MSKWTKNSESAFIFTQYPIKIYVPSLEFQKKIKKLKEVFFEKSQKSAILTKNGQKSQFFFKIKVVDSFSELISLN
jgi:hypothetical protein